MLLFCALLHEIHEILVYNFYYRIVQHFVELFKRHQEFDFPSLVALPQLQTLSSMSNEIVYK